MTSPAPPAAGPSPRRTEESLLGPQGSPEEPAEDTAPAGGRGRRQRGPGAIQRQGDFSHIYKQGRRYRTALLTAVVCRREGAGADGEAPASGVRAAFVVSRKVARQAVRRNRVRRRLREAFRALLAPEAGAVDVIVIAHREAAGADYWALYAALGEALRRARLSPARPSPAEGS